MGRADKEKKKTAGDELESTDDEMKCAAFVRAENRMQTALQKKKDCSRD